MSRGPVARQARGMHEHVERMVASSANMLSASVRALRIERRASGERRRGRVERGCVEHDCVCSERRASEERNDQRGRAERSFVECDRVRTEPRVCGERGHVIVTSSAGASSTSIYAALTCARVQVSVGDVVASSAGASSAISREAVAPHEIAVRCERSPHATRSPSVSHREAAMHHEGVAPGSGEPLLRN